MNNKLTSWLSSGRIAVLCTLLLFLSFACNDSTEDPTQSIAKIAVQLRNTDTYEYPTVGGDEEGAVIAKQAAHYQVSEIRRDSSTNWVAVYIYRPQAGYLGNDYAELDVHTNGVGTSEHHKVTKLGFQFTITN